MGNFNSYALTIGFLGAIALSNGNALAREKQTHSSAVADAENSQVSSITIDLPERALFSVIASDRKGTDHGRQAYQTFQSRALPLAAEYGFRRHGTMILNGTAIGSFKPQVFLLTSWPSLDAFGRFQKDERWAEFAPLRASIWEDIRYYRKVQDEGLSLTLRSDKFYTLAIANIDQRNPEDYAQYLANLEGPVRENGGRFLLKIENPSLESLSGTQAPGQMTFIEWDDEDGVNRLLSSQAYAATRQLVASGTTELSFYRLKLRP